MPTISQKKKDKIQEQILHYLFIKSPESIYTNKIANEIARDEEFTKSLLIDLKIKNIVNEINKNPKGATYKKRQRWRLSQSAFEIYSKHQLNNTNL